MLLKPIGLVQLLLSKLGRARGISAEKREEIFSDLIDLGRMAKEGIRENAYATFLQAMVDIDHTIDG